MKIYGNCLSVAKSKVVAIKFSELVWSMHHFWLWYNQGEFEEQMVAKISTASEIKLHPDSYRAS